MNITAIIDKLAEGIDLTAEEAAYGMAELMDGKLPPAVAGAFLLLLRVKGETPTELTAAVQSCLSRAVPVKGLPEGCIDIVGTGGDGKNSFNCSTVSALIVAGLGYKVCKHGNRAVSSTSGAADALESVGYPLGLDAEGVRRSMEKSGFAFCLAPNFHPGFRAIVPIRKQLGVRTLFNVLGPMINPARPDFLMMGVAKPAMLDSIAAVLARCGYRRALVLHGAGGYDEATTFGPVQARLVENGEVRKADFDPAELGFTPPAGGEAALTVSTTEEARAAVRVLLHGQGSPAMRDMVALNVAAALHLLEPDESLKDCADRARRAVADAVALPVLQHFAEL